jgi:FG-GAP repeat
VNRFPKLLLAFACLLAVFCSAQTRPRRGLSQLPSDVHAAITSALSKAQLLASDGAPDDEFGFSAAINSSGNTIVVGAPNENSFTGAVYVFVEPASGWANATQTAKVTVAGLSGIAEFGDTVAISGTGDTIVVGAPAAGAGTAYVFSATGGDWSNGGTQVAALTASDGLAGDYLGSSVAISSNGETVVAAAVNATIGKNQDQGAVYVFTESASGWANESQKAKLIASNGVVNQNLGSAVSISGNTIAAGAWDYALGSGGNGAVYVFTKTGSSWVNATQTAELTASDGNPLDVLGESVSISGSTIVAGAPNHKVGSNEYQGALYVFVEPATGGWVNAFQTAELTASNGIKDASLGDSVSISGRFIVGGAYCQEVVSNTCQGEVYAYVEPTAGWVNSTETYDLTAKGGSPGDSLGWSSSVTSSGPFVVSGALGYESYTGAVYLFER